MSNLPMKNRVLLSIANGLITGAIAVWIYVTFATQGHDFWNAVQFHPLNYIGMIIVCCLNTFGFFCLLAYWVPLKRWKGFLLGGMVAVIGSFICSFVMGIGTGRTFDLVFVTLFFFPVSGVVGSLAGLILAHLVRDRQASE